MDRRDFAALGRGSRDLSRQPHLVSPMEPERLLRKGLRTGAVRRARAAFVPWLGGALRHYGPQRETRGRFARSSATLFRSGEAEPERSARLSDREADRVPETL